MYSFAPCSRDPMMGKASGSPASTLIGREDIEGASWKVNKEQIPVTRMAVWWTDGVLVVSGEGGCVWTQASFFLFMSLALPLASKEL